MGVTTTEAIFSWGEVTEARSSGTTEAISSVILGVITRAIEGILEVTLSVEARVVSRPSRREVVGVTESNRGEVCFEVSIFLFLFLRPLGSSWGEVTLGVTGATVVSSCRVAILGGEAKVVVVVVASRESCLTRAGVLIVAKIAGELGFDLRRFLHFEKHDVIHWFKLPTQCAFRKRTGREGQGVRLYF